MYREKQTRMQLLRIYYARLFVQQMHIKIIMQMWILYFDMHNLNLLKSLDAFHLATQVSFYLCFSAEKKINRRLCR